MERRQLGLRHLTDLSEHLAGRGLIEADGGIDLPHRFERPCHPLRVVFAGEHRLVPRGGHERHRREVVELVRPDDIEDPDQRELVEQISRMDGDAVEQVVYAPVVVRTGAAHDAVHLVAVREKQFGEVGAVLARETRDESAFCHGQKRQVYRNRMHR
jgi:hypothetical protein